jgi:hypothetical protein
MWSDPILELKFIYIHVINLWIEDSLSTDSWWEWWLQFCICSEKEWLSYSETEVFEALSLLISCLLSDHFRHVTDLNVWVLIVHPLNVVWYGISLNLSLLSQFLNKVSWYVFIVLEITSPWTKTQESTLFGIIVVFILLWWSLDHKYWEIVYYMTLIINITYSAHCLLVVSAEWLVIKACKFIIFLHEVFEMFFIG